MTNNNQNLELDEGLMQEIVERYDRDDEFRVSRAYLDGGAISPASRLKRAALNQICEGEATISRYSIWANTVRDNIIKAEQLMTEGSIREAKKLLCQAANSLSAFCEIQTYFDPFEKGCEPEP